MAEPIDMPFGLWTRVGPCKEPCIRMGFRSLHAVGQFLGERTYRGMPDDTAVSGAKMAEPDEMPFGL